MIIHIRHAGGRGVIVRNPFFRILTGKRRHVISTTGTILSSE